MSMSVGSGKVGRAAMSEINMTPMIDVLLVLLVIFMIAQPLLQRSIDVQLPIEKPNQTQANNTSITLEMFADGRMTINTLPVTTQTLDAELKRIYSARPDKVMFFKAEPKVKYQEVISVMDAARGAGVEVLGAMLPRTVTTTPPGQ
jgi:biopolymer transport protein ExbD